jgi:hypothetical protein
MCPHNPQHIARNVVRRHMREQPHTRIAVPRERAEHLEVRPLGGQRPRSGGGARGVRAEVERRALGGACEERDRGRAARNACAG